MVTPPPHWKIRQIDPPPPWKICSLPWGRGGYGYFLEPHINKQETAIERVFLVHFLQKVKANNKSVTLRLAALAFIIMPTKIP